MALTLGTRLGPYEVLSALGAGGMGEVYRARDTKLGREVALKVLPDSFANDTDRLARFEREAKTLASLNHPHIAQIYGFEQSGSKPALVMELVEGPDLSQRIAHGPIPLIEALSIAQQIASALELAHEQGIVHRDLKPANIKVDDGGTVKVLDFGLAKVVAPEGASATADAIDLPTISVHATEAGLILGTAAYMSPEQAKGRPVDKRADLWAFGAVLYEMLTGRRPFRGDGATDTIARVLSEEPDWSALPPGTPVPILALLRRCLEKDQRRRLDSAVAARFALEDGVVGAAAAPIGVLASSRHSIASIATIVAAVALVCALVVVLMPPDSPDPALPAMFAIVPPLAQPLNLQGDARDIAMSPNGRHLVYRSGGAMKGGSPLMLRAIDELDARPLAGIDGALAPFFSPDSQWIGFFADGELRKVSIRGGPVVTICPVTGTSRGATWGDDDTIIFAMSGEGSGLWRVSAAGGSPTALTTPDAALRETSHSFPFILPGSRAVLFTTTASSGAADASQVAVLDLKTREWKVMVRGASDASYVETGHLLYAATGTLHAVRFDSVRLEAAGDPVPLIEHVLMAGSGAANYAVARNGTLIYVPGGVGAQTTARSLVWVDRRGREEPIGAPPRPYSSPRLSPDGTQVAVEIFDRNNELWIWDLTRAVLRRFSLDPSFHGMPVWTGDGRRLIFASTRDGRSRLYEQASDGTGPIERLATTAVRATAVTPDGRRVIGFETRENAPAEIVVFARGAAGSEPSGEVRFPGVFAEISPDGRYLAYQSRESGQLEVWVRPFPQVESGRWQVSTTGGSRAAWAHSGRELFYVDASGLFMAVPVQTSGTTFTFGNPAKVFDTRYSWPFPARHYDIAPDDQRFLMMKDNTAGDPNATPASMVVILNWSEELKRRVPTQ